VPHDAKLVACIGKRLAITELNRDGPMMSSGGASPFQAGQRKDELGRCCNLL